jgi:hypothetical protein
MLRLAAVSAVVLLAGACAASGVDAGASRSAGPAASVTSPAVSTSMPSTRPELCSAARPETVAPFPFNRDTARRRQIIRLGEVHGGSAGFGNATAADVAALLEEKFLDPAERQNESPDAWQIFQFLCRHDTVRAFGYAVTEDRSDYRVALDAIEGPIVDTSTLVDARKLCVDAEADFTEGVDCFWD